MTPEATASVLERSAPGIAEAIRADSISKTPHGLLSRGVAGVRGRTLVVNLPGSTGGCRDGFAILKPALSACARAARRRGDGAPPDMTPLRFRSVASLVKIEHTVFALPFAYVGAFLARRRRAVGARAALDHGCDGRRPLARDGRSTG